MTITRKDKMNTLKTKLNKIIDDIKKSGLYKSERLITSKQEALIAVSDKTNILNF